MSSVGAQHSAEQQQQLDAHRSEVLLQVPHHQHPTLPAVGA